MLSRNVILFPAENLPPPLNDLNHVRHNAFLRPHFPLNNASANRSPVAGSTPTALHCRLSGVPLLPGGNGIALPHSFPTRSTRSSNRAIAAPSAQETATGAATPPRTSSMPPLLPRCLKGTIGSYSESYPKVNL